MTTIVYQMAAFPLCSCIPVAIHIMVECAPTMWICWAQVKILRHQQNWPSEVTAYLLLSGVRAREVTPEWSLLPHSWGKELSEVNSALVIAEGKVSQHFSKDSKDAFPLLPTRYLVNGKDLGRCGGNVWEKGIRRLFFNILCEL